MPKQPMTRLPQTPLLRYTLIVGASVIFVVTLVHLLSPPEWSFPTPQLKVPSLHYTASSPKLSAWLNDIGYLRYDPHQEWNSQWDLLLPDAEGYECDEQPLLDNGQSVCRNTLKTVSNIYSNVGTQQRIMQAGGRHKITVEGEAELAESHKQLAGLAGKRILVIGDSVDRTWVTQLVDLTSPTSFYTNIDLYSTPDNGIPLLIEPTHTKRAIAMKDNCGVAIIPIASSPSSVETHDSIAQSFAARYTAESPRSEDQLRIDYAFVFGIIGQCNSISEPRHIDTTERIANLTRLLGGDVNDPHDRGYDAININFGLWDLAGFQRENYLEFFADDAPALTLDWIARYTEACERFILQLKDTYGHNVPMYFRLVHDTNTGGYSNFLLGFTPEVEAKITSRPGPFKPLRLAQMRQVQEGIAKRMGLELQPFARRFAGQHLNYLADDVHPTRSASMVHMEMVFRLLMGR